MVRPVTTSTRDALLRLRTAITLIRYNSHKPIVIIANPVLMVRPTILRPGNVKPSKSRDHNVPATKSTTKLTTYVLTAHKASFQTTEMVFV